MQAPLRRRPPSLSRQTCRGRSRGVGSAWEENGLRANGLEVKPLLRLRARNWDAKRTTEVGKFPRSQVARKFIRGHTTLVDRMGQFGGQKLGGPRYEPPERPMFALPANFL